MKKVILPVKDLLLELYAERVKCGLCVLAVAWASFSISLMLAVGEGLRNGIGKAFQVGNGHAIYLTPGQASINYGRFHQNQALVLTEADAALIASLPQISHFLPQADWQESIRYHSINSWSQPLAVTPAFQSALKIPLLPASRWFNQDDMEQQRKVVVLAYSVAIRLFNKNQPLTAKQLQAGWQHWQTKPLGQQMQLGQYDYTVIGVIPPIAGFLGNARSLDFYSFTPLSSWQHHHRNASLSAIDILPQPGVDRSTLMQTIARSINIKQGAALNDLRLVHQIDMLNKNQQIQHFLLGLQALLGLIGGITLLVAGVGIANMMYAMVARATHNIGIKMALGASPKLIQWHYMTQSLVMMFTGGMLGTATAYFSTLIPSHFQMPNNYLYNKLGKPVPEISCSVLAVVILALTLIGLLAAWFPARRAANTQPMQALQEH